MDGEGLVIRRLMTGSTCLLLVVACGGSAGSTTTQTGPSPPEGAITVESTTTTATPDPSTTTTAAITTTSSPPEGDALVVAVQGFVLGWWADGEWHQEPEYKPLIPETPFEVVSVEGETFSIIGGVPEVACEWAGPDIRRVPFDIEPSLTPRLGVSAPWSVSAGEHRAVEANEALEAVAVLLLSQVGIDEDEPVFAQVFETDIDGNGEFETLAVLDNAAGVFEASYDAYGIAFLVDEDGAAEVIGEYDTYADGNEAAHVVTQYRIVAVVDVNSDGRDEVALRWDSFESGGDTLFEYDLDANSMRPVLSQGCGV